MLFPLLLWTALLCHISDGSDLVIDQSPTFSVLAPAKIRPGTKQNILLEGHKLSQALTVSIRVYDYPTSQTVLMTGSVTLNSDNNYSALTAIEIDPIVLQPDEKKKYVKLVAQFGTYHNAERILPVSFRSGYIFIQTDKPVYNPGDTVRYRAFVSDTEFHAAERTISLEIQVNVTGNDVDVITLNGGIVSLTMEEIKKAYPDTNSLLGSSVYVKASVMTSSGSDLVEAEKSGIKIVMSPYVLSIKDTPKYFKPGLPLGMMVTVSDHNRSPAQNIPVKISFLEKPVTEHGGTIKVYIDMPEIYSSQTLKVETADPLLKPEQQAIQEMHVEPYAAFNDYRNYLHISMDSSRVVVGDTVNFNAHIKCNPPERKQLVEQMTYAVLSKGNIIHVVRKNVKDLDVINLPLVVTTEMLPAFRFVAYYTLPWQPKAEVVADSLFVDVEDRCVGSLSVGSVEGEELTSYSPGSNITFEVKGDLGAKVSLVAVDNAIFLLSKSRLTQKKVWEVVGQGDMGCTAGGGRDNMGVFSDAGLMFYSSTGGSTDDRKDSSSMSRRRRSAAKLQLKEQLEKEYFREGEFLQRCCMDGMREIPMPHSCYRRSRYITEDQSCVSAFLRCCAKYRGEELGVVTRPPTTTPPPIIVPPSRDDNSLRPGRGGGDFALSVELAQAGRYNDVEEEEEEEEEEFDEDDLADLKDNYVRSKFFESWLWTDIRLPSVPKSDGLAVFPVNAVLPDSITQWGFLAVSASPQTGFCVAEPYKVRTWKPFFVDLRLPHSVSRNEHVEIKAVLHNYSNLKLQVFLILEKTEDMCSVAFTKRNRQQVSVEASSSKVISYTIIPLKTGELPLQVTAIVPSLMAQDAVRKNLHVVVEGIQTIKVKSFVLNPAEGRVPNRNF
ncbi:complement C3-like protein [Labeo rohita]|uniref:Complement C3-like protein n=1 Tax=Labeo rohita TaxID=84645 RepID=A0A498NT12_LABRO|nr:complement C3-like protein [Labeo rohita]